MPLDSTQLGSMRSLDLDRTSHVNSRHMPASQKTCLFVRTNAQNFFLFVFLFFPYLVFFFLEGRQRRHLPLK